MAATRSNPPADASASARPVFSFGIPGQAKATAWPGRGKAANAGLFLRIHAGQIAGFRSHQSLKDMLVEPGLEMLFAERQALDIQQAA